MFSKNNVFCISTILLIVLQSTRGDSDVLSCKPFNKKSELAFAINLGLSGTMHCPPPDIIGDDDLMFCCTEENTGFPICCDLQTYVNQNIVMLLGALFGISFLLVLLCCCCKRRHEVRTIVYPGFYARSRQSTLLREQA